MKWLYLKQISPIQKIQIEIIWKPWPQYTCAKLLQSCPTLCDPINCSLPGFFVHGERTLERSIQARILERIAISSTTDLPNPGIEPRCPELQAGSLPTKLWGNTLTFCLIYVTLVRTSKLLHLATIILKIQLWGNSNKWNTFRGQMQPWNLVKLLWIIEPLKNSCWTNSS